MTADLTLANPPGPDIRCGTCAHARWQQGRSGRAMTRREGTCGWRLTGVRWPWAYYAMCGLLGPVVATQRSIMRHAGVGCAQWRAK